MNLEDSTEDLFQKGMHYNQESSSSYAPTLARQYFQLAAHKGHPKATVNLALMMHYGQGGVRDFAEAVRLLAGAYFQLGNSEALDCLAEVLRQEVDVGQSMRNNVDLSRLAERVDELQNLSEQVRGQLLRLIS